MYLFCKRIFDIVFSALALMILLPVFVPVILILLLTGEHAVFYLQNRVGYKNKIFDIWKFATMLKNSPNMGSGDVTTRNDPRVTKIGKFLRKSKLNELPQLINVLMGDMSFVGPRPLMVAGFNRYSDELKQTIYNIKPGLTGIGSIVFRDEELIITKSTLPPHECYKQIILPRKGEVEMWYQQNRSFLADVLIIGLTGWYIIFPDSDLLYRVFPTLPKSKI